MFVVADVGVKELEQKVQDLMDLCERLSADNKRLQKKHNEWMTERSRLLEHDELTKQRLKAMRNRLSALERDCA